MAVNPLKEYVQRYGEEETARRLSQVLGKEIKPTTVRMQASFKNKRPSAHWLAALGLDPSLGGSTHTPPPKPNPDLDRVRQPFPVEPPETQAAGSVPPPEPGVDPSPGDGAGRAAEQDPIPPTDADFQLPPRGGLLAAQAKERIAALHVFAGSAIATAADADGFENDRGVGGGVAKLWTDKAPDIADAWIAWAEEGNRFAASFVRLMATGGAGSSLALGYASLLGGTAYILGHMPDNEATRVIYGRYSRYRTVVPEPAPAPEPGRDPAVGNGAGGAVDDVAAAAGR